MVDLQSIHDQALIHQVNSCVIGYDSQTKGEALSIMTKDTDFMNSVEEPSLVAAELTGCKQRLVEYDMPQILMSFARLDISGLPG